MCQGVKGRHSQPPSACSIHQLCLRSVLSHSRHTGVPLQAPREAGRCGPDVPQKRAAAGLRVRQACVTAAQDRAAPQPLPCRVDCSGQQGHLCPLWPCFLLACRPVFLCVECTLQTVHATPRTRRRAARRLHHGASAGPAAGVQPLGAAAPAGQGGGAGGRQHGRSGALRWHAFLQAAAAAGAAGAAGQQIAALWAGRGSEVAVRHGSWEMSGLFCGHADNAQDLACTLAHLLPTSLLTFLLKLSRLQQLLITLAQVVTVSL